MTLTELSDIFSNSGFMPHIHCYLDRPSLVWTMVVTDTLIGLSYVVISATLYILVRRTRLPFQLAFFAFGTFILACGATHFMEVYNLWIPNYWLAALFKVLTAAASVATAIYVVELVPNVEEYIAAAKTITESKSTLESFFLKRLSTPPELTKVLARAIYLPVSVAVGLILIALFEAQTLRSSQSWVDHSNNVLQLAQSLKDSAAKADTSLRDYCLTGIEKLANDARAGERDFSTEYAELKALVSNNPD
jgi:hypothetical protein